MALLVFDLDGTLVDSARDLANSTNDVLESYGCRRLEQLDIVKMVGEGARKLVERALSASACAASLDEALSRFHAVYDTRLVEHTRSYEGIEDVLASVKGRATLAVLTNKPIAPTRRILDALDLSKYFALVTGGDGPFPRKPDPASLLNLAQQSAVSIADVLMVGDSKADADVARNAGASFCLARYGFGQAGPRTPLLEHEYAVETPRDLRDVIDLFLVAASERLSERPT